jgi:hypothetical protein
VPSCFICRRDIDTITQIRKASRIEVGGGLEVAAHGTCLEALEEGIEGEYIKKATEKRLIEMLIEQGVQASKQLAPQALDEVLMRKDIN